MQRRGFLVGLTAALAAPAVIRTPGLLMPVKALRKTRFSYPGYEGEIGWGADGCIRSIQITTPGSGYTTEPAVSLLSQGVRRAFVSSDFVQYYRANPVLAAIIDGRPILNG